MSIFVTVGRRGLVVLAALAGLAQFQPVSARTVVSVGVGVAPGWYGPPPVYHYVPPPAYVVAPPPAYVVTPPPVVAAPAAPAPATWLYCGNPAGYYPYVQACSMPWQQVPATPPAP